MPTTDEKFSASEKSSNKTSTFKVDLAQVVVDCIAQSWDSSLVYQVKNFVNY